MPDRDERITRAAALRYDRQGPGAPRVVAAGRGEVARRIVEAARAAGVPVRDDAALAEALSALELDTEVPEELWAAVAEALVWAHRMDLGALREARGA
ncbi:MAG TPA: EscU/YscU/HrcU family type III secretion system export apparatus switch protein [Capillimicrobium sp.]|nr:EscU/YscU/HrcU family type III secretion system export apparatus switch protein [Capillimicrobium sp.]